jgi:hypothetical protein
LFLREDPEAVDNPNAFHREIHLASPELFVEHRPVEPAQVSLPDPCPEALCAKKDDYRSKLKVIGLNGRFPRSATPDRRCRPQNRQHLGMDESKPHQFGFELLAQRTSHGADSISKMGLCGRRTHGTFVVPFLAAGGPNRSRIVAPERSIAQAGGGSKRIRPPFGIRRTIPAVRIAPARLRSFILKYPRKRPFPDLLVFGNRANVVVRNKAMADYSYIFFNKTPMQLRILGARGGRAYGRNQRARRALMRAQPPPVPQRTALCESTAQAMAALDAQFPWLRCAER